MPAESALALPSRSRSRPGPLLLGPLIALSLGQPCAARAQVEGGAQLFSLADADTLIGSDASEGAGAALAVLDFNGDGLDDLAVAAPPGDGVETDAGRLYLWFGGQPWPEGMGDLSDAPLTLLGDELGDAFGGGMLVGDIDQDGLDDLLVAAPFTREGGRLYVFRGRSTGLSGTHAASDYADARIRPPRAGQCLGLGMTIGDIAEGPELDLVLGAPCARQAQQREGGLYLLPDFDPPDGDWWVGGVEGLPALPGEVEIPGTVNGAEFGRSIGIAPDLLASGRPHNLLVGEPQWTDGRLDSNGNQLHVGRTLVFAEREDWSGLTSDDADVRIEGDEFAGQAGLGLLAGPDLNGDEWPDLLVGVPGASDLAESGGRVAIYFGDEDGLEDTTTADFDASIVGTVAQARIGSGFSVIDAPVFGPSLLIGSPSLSVGGLRGGAIYVLPMEPRGWGAETPIDDLASAIIVGQRNAEGLGASLAVLERPGAGRGRALVLGAPAATRTRTGQGLIYRFDDETPEYEPEPIGDDDDDDDSDSNLGDPPRGEGCDCAQAPERPASPLWVLSALVLLWLRRRTTA